MKFKKYNLHVSFPLVILAPLGIALIFYALESSNLKMSSSNDAYKHIVEIDDMRPSSNYSHKCDFICDYPSKNHQGNERNKNVMLLGDSHADHLTEFVREHALVKDDMDVYVRSMGFCYAMPDTLQPKNTYKKCADIKKIIPDLNKETTDYVVLAQSWSNALYYDNIFPHFHYELKDPPKVQISDNESIGEDLLISNELKLEYSLERTVKMIVDKGIKLVLVDDFYDVGNSNALRTVKSDTNTCVMEKYSSGSDADCTIRNNTNIDPTRIFIKKLFQRLKLKFPMIKTVSMLDLQCSKNTCETEVDGYPLYRHNDDVAHITSYASQALGKQTAKDKNLFDF